MMRGCVREGGEREGGVKRRGVRGCLWGRW